LIRAENQKINKSNKTCDAIASLLYVWAGKLSTKEGYANKFNSMDEKERFTYYRRRDFKISGGRLREVEQKWGKYCFVPLDIPKLSEADKITDWFFENSERVSKLRPDVSTFEIRPTISKTDMGRSAFKSIDVLVDSERKDTKVWSLNTNHNFLNEFPRFHQELMDVFPFVKIEHFRFWQSTGYINSHRDDNDFRDFPCSFRSMIYDENPSPTLHVEEFLPNKTIPTKSTAVPRLEDSSSFVWNNLRTKHYSNFDHRYNKILLIINDCHIDYKKYDQLLEKSIVKYSSSLLVSDYFIDDYIENPYQLDNLPKSELRKIINNSD
jgi:hypothetical protein